MALYRLPFPGVPLLHIFSRQKHRLCKFFLGQLLQPFRCALCRLPYVDKERLENTVLSCVRTMAGMVSAEGARKKTEWERTAAIGEEMQKLLA